MNKTAVTKMIVALVLLAGTAAQASTCVLAVYNSNVNGWSCENNPNSFMPVIQLDPKEVDNGWALLTEKCLSFAKAKAVIKAESACRGSKLKVTYINTNRAQEEKDKEDLELANEKMQNIFDQQWN